MRNHDFYIYDDGNSRVALSREGLRRARNDNAALLKSARLHEIVAAALSLAGVALFVAWGVDLIARGLV